jgi:hypothetical protein
MGWAGPFYDVDPRSGGSCCALWMTAREPQFVAKLVDGDGASGPTVLKARFDSLTDVNSAHEIVPRRIAGELVEQALCFFFDRRGRHRTKSAEEE